MQLFDMFCMGYSTTAVCLV